MNKLNLLQYRMKIRKELTKLPKVLIEITLEESKKALETTKKKGKTS